MEHVNHCITFLSHSIPGFYGKLVSNTSGNDWLASYVTLKISVFSVSCLLKCVRELLQSIVTVQKVS